VTLSGEERKVQCTAAVTALNVTLRRHSLPTCERWSSWMSNATMSLCHNASSKRDAIKAVKAVKASSHSKTSKAGKAAMVASGSKNLATAAAESWGTF
jgi:hypothetical protein